MKKCIAFLLVVMFTNTLVFGFTVGGTGTSSEPYLITSLDDLKWIADQVNAGTNFSGKYFKQTANIDASATTDWNGGKGWTAIGGTDDYYVFSGTYDGQGYTISNLYINNPTVNMYGLFGYCSNATLQNIGLTNVSIIANSDVGGLVGYIEPGTIRNCYVTGSVTAKGSAAFVGGLCGEAYTTYVDRSYAACTVVADKGAAGGLMGYLAGGSLTCSYSSGSVTVNSEAWEAGGLLGEIYSGTIVRDCFSESSVSANGVLHNEPYNADVSNIGGLIGGNGGTVANCYAKGSVTVTNAENESEIGGLLGENRGTVSSSYSLSSLSVTPLTGNTPAVGGFVGVNYDECSYAAIHYPTNVTFAFTPGTVNSCYWNSSIYANGCGSNSFTYLTPYTATFSATGSTTAQLQTTSTYSGWDFPGAWDRIDTRNNKYPYLEWQTPPFIAAISTMPISTNGVTSVTVGGYINIDGGATVTERGVVYSSADVTPTIGEAGVTKDANGAGMGSFSKSITGLSGITYYVCAYAINAAGISYGKVVSFTIPIAPTITWNNPTDIVYGTQLSATQLNASADVAGTFTYTPALGTKLNAGTAQNLKVDFTPDDAANYTTATKTVTIDVAKATPVMTWTNPTGITYGTTLSATQLNASADVAGTFTYTPTLGTKLNAGTAQDLKVDFTPTDAANYTTATKTVTIDVAKATPVMTWTNPTSITYGTTLSATQLNASADVAGTFTYTPALGTKLNAGAAQNLKVDFTPTDAANYTTATKTVTIDVAKATPVMTWTNPTGITYGTMLSATQLNASADVAGTFTYTPALGTKLNAGTAQNLKVDFTPDDAANYTIATKTVTIDVAKATPVMTWNNPAGITYGTTLSATQLNASADVAGSFTYTPALGTKLNAGTAQNLKVDFTPIDAANYTTATKTVTIDVAKATPVMTWTNPTGITYGTTLSATQLNASADVAGTFTYTPALGTKLNAGTAQNLKVDFTPTDATNYTTATKTVTIDVARATPVMTWNNPAGINNATALSNTQLNASADVAGTFTYTPAIGTKLNVGNAQVLKVDFVPSDLINYEPASKTVLINVSPATGIAEAEHNESIVLYPNPVINAFNVLGIDGKATIFLTDLNGKLVLTKVISADEKVFVSNLSSGIYLIKIMTNNGAILKKMVKE